MPYYERDADAVDDFDEYDPTPYGGGYDLDLTYGRPLPPSDETCHTNSSSTGEIDYERPHFSTHAEPSAYSDDHLQVEYGSYARYKVRPHPAHGFTPGGTGGETFVDANPGSGYGGRPQYEKPHGEDFVSGYGRRPDSEYGSGGYKPPSEEYGSGYGRRQEAEHGSGGYGGRKPSYGEGGYGDRPSYGDESPRKTGYGRKEDDYEKPSYKKRHDDDDDEGSRRKYGSGDDEGSGRRKKYGDDDSDDDDDDKKKHRRRNKHHHKKHSDEE